MKKLCIIILCACLCSCNKPGTEVLLEQSVLENQDEKVEQEVAQEETKVEEAYIWVDVSGAVQRPGVYKLQEKARVFEAIEAAGGFTEEADVSWINQAVVLEDGEKIQVLTKEEVELELEHPKTTKDSDGKINLNTASLEELQKIPGIGEARALAIIRYREEYGKFKTPEDVQQIPGIKGKTYEKIADYISIK